MSSAPGTAAGNIAGKNIARKVNVFHKLKIKHTHAQEIGAVLEAPREGNFRGNCPLR